MIDWASIRAALAEAVVATVANDVPGIDVHWELEDEGAAWHPFPFVAMRLAPMQSVGVDLVAPRPDNEIPDPIAHDKARALVGQRQVTWQIKVETDEQQDGAGSARERVETIRTRLRRPDVLAGLRAAGIAISTVGPTVDGSYQTKKEARMASFATCNVVLNVAMNDAPFGVAIIKTVEITNQNTGNTFEVQRP